jgi:predicted aldo/keto reductase-like oxidoreductase
VEIRELGTTGIEVDAIGFGTEHLPPDADIIAEIVETAVERGGPRFVDVLQIDPAGDGAYVWDGLGPIIREHRDKLVLACHWGIGYLYDLDSCKRTFPDALAHVGNDFVDVAMMTMVGEPGRTGAWLDDSLAELERYRRDGHIGCIGASVHDVHAAIELVERDAIDVLMFAVNMTQHGDERQQSLYQACAEHGVGLIAMKPYSAGLLLRAGGEPTSIMPLQCLDYVLDQPVATVVPGVRNADELRAALRYETASTAEKDHTSALEAVHRELAGHCVHCRKCMPCAQGIDITAIVAMVGWARSGMQDWMREMYANQRVKPSACDGRGVCMASCDFDVDIVGVMRRAVELFET